MLNSSIKRINIELRELNSYEYCNYCNYDEVKNVITVGFFGPKGTIYEDKSYIVKWVLSDRFPFQPADGYFVGEAPNHEFYAFDFDDEDREVRVTNINGRVGKIFCGNYSPTCHIKEYIEKIIFSLTEEGTNNMKKYLISQPEKVSFYSVKSSRK